MTTGENIPTTREAPGNVLEGSLAAESARKGGAFASNPDQHEQGHEQQARKPGTGTGKTASETGSLENQSSYGGAAPTYLAGQMRRDPAGPHGKNLKEGGFEGSGTEAGPLPEPGSAEDPGRAATRGLSAAAAAAPGVGRAGTGGVEEGSWYTPLKGDEPA